MIPVVILMKLLIKHCIPIHIHSYLTDHALISGRDHILMKMSNHHVIVFLLLLRAVLFQASPSATVSVQLSNPVHRVDEDFLSVTIDAGSISRNWSDIDFTSTKVINMAKALYPAMLRIGGTSQDYLLFKPDLGEFRSNFTMTTSQWDAVNTFVKAVKWKLIFGLNQLLRNSEGNWDSGNAKELIMYTLNMNYPVAWELGNGIYMQLYKVTDSIFPTRT